MPAMMRTDMPETVRRFILTSIPSVPYLEAILLLRSEPGVAWDAQRVASRLYVAPAQASELLTALAASGIAAAASAEPDSFSYRPASGELAAMLEALAQVYSGKLVAVADLIHSRIDKRAQHFADAFRWRKES
jgi:hypothetical protein